MSIFPATAALILIAALRFNLRRRARPDVINSSGRHQTEILFSWAYASHGGRSQVHLIILTPFDARRAVGGV